MKHNNGMLGFLQAALNNNHDLVICQLSKIDDDMLVFMIKNDQDLSLYIETCKIVNRDKFEDMKIKHISQSKIKVLICKN